MPQISLTHRGWTLVGATVGLATGSYLLGALELLVIAVTAAVLLVGSATWLNLVRAPELELARHVHPSRLHVGSDGRVDLQVVNRGPGTSPSLILTDWFDGQRRAARFVVPALRRDASARAAYRVPTRRRGRYRVGPLTLAVGDPFGLARRALPGLDDLDLVVRPRVHDILAPVAPGSRIMVDTDAPATRAIVSDLGTELLSVREYVVGDDLRRVHWRATARSADLMIRQDEARWRSRAAIVLDTHVSHHDDASLETSVEATASIVARLVRLRRRVEVITSAGTPLGTGGDPRHDLIDRLASVGPEPDDHLPRVLERLREHRGLDLVVIVLGDVTPAARRAVANLSALGAATTVAVLTRTARLAPTPSLVVVDASVETFPTAWNQAFARWHPARVS